MGGRMAYRGAASRCLWAQSLCAARARRLSPGARTPASGRWWTMSRSHSLRSQAAGRAGVQRPNVQLRQIVYQHVYIMRSWLWLAEHLSMVFSACAGGTCTWRAKDMLLPCLQIVYDTHALSGGTLCTKST